MCRIFLFLCILSLAACSPRVDVRVPGDLSETSDQAVNINTATIAQLETLPNVGRKTAESIVRFREENGPFRRPEHLMLIRGISETRFIEIRDRVRTSDP